MKGVEGVEGVEGHEDPSCLQVGHGSTSEALDNTTPATLCMHSPRSLKHTPLMTFKLPPF